MLSFNKKNFSIIHVTKIVSAPEKRIIRFSSKNLLEMSVYFVHYQRILIYFLGKIKVVPIPYF